MTPSPTRPAGIDATLDLAIRPQDDLYRHVNGTWLRTVTIPEDRSRAGSVYDLREHAQTAMRTIIERAASGAVPSEGSGVDSQKIGDLYTSFMDEATVEALGTAPIIPLLEEIDAIVDVDQVLRMAGRFPRLGISSFFDLTVDGDPDDPESSLPFLEQAGLGLPDEAYYRDDRFAAIREQYRGFLVTLTVLADGGDDDDTYASRAARVLAIEHAIATVHWDNVTTRDTTKTHNRLSWAEVAALAPAVDLGVWRDGLGAPAGALDTLIVREPDFVSGLGALLATRPLEEWKDWLSWQVIRSMAPFLTTALSDAHFSFTGGVLRGMPKQPDRWKRGVQVVEEAMGDAVGRLYVDEHFDASARSEIDAIVANLLLAQRDSIRDLEWMTDRTRQEALQKLSKFHPRIGYPESWRDYSFLRIDATDLVGNIRAAASGRQDHELGKIGRPVDHDEWFTTPQTVNAFYNPAANEIVFPAAILQPPLFDPHRDAATNYGAIGVMIGHEIGHGFDDQGARYDGDGQLRDWWSAADRAAFDERAAALIAQYDVLVPADAPHGHVNGALTVGENIGDLAGISIAWKAYLVSLGGAEPPIIDGLTGAERFFLSWASIWQEAIRPEEAARFLATGTHSPAEFRCNQIVRNTDLFHETFGVVEGDGMWLDPAERISIW
jgi:putative endopeptidase